MFAQYGGSVNFYQALVNNILSLDKLDSRSDDDVRSASVDKANYRPIEARGTQTLLPSQWLLLLFASVSYDVKVYGLSQIKEKVQWRIKKLLARR